MATNIPVPDADVELMQQRLAGGQYASAGDYVGALIRRDHQAASHKAELRKKIAAGMASLRAGEGADGEAFLAQMTADLEALDQAGI